MTLENLYPAITSVGVGFFVGIMLGYFVKKIIKVLMFVAGGLVGLLLYLQQEQIISVDIEKLGKSSMFILNSAASSFDNITQIGDSPSLGIPLVGALAAGVAIGFVKG
jgi:uncharacterized membrane protein (Fun14 family)